MFWIQDWMMYREYMNLDYLTLPLMRKSIPPFAAFWLSLSTPQSLTWIGAKHAACEYRGIVSTEQVRVVIPFSYSLVVAY